MRNTTLKRSDTFIFVKLKDVSQGLRGKEEEEKEEEEEEEEEEKEEEGVADRRVCCVTMYEQIQINL